MTEEANPRLRRWAEGARTWDDYPSTLPGCFAEWLQKGSPADWHQAADNWNWDYGLAPLQWIVSQPDCDLATALLIYYRGEPSYYLRWSPADCPEHAREGCELLTTIRQRVAAADFQQRFAFNARSDGAYEIVSRDAPVSEDPNFPAVLPGQPVPSSTEWDDGYPLEVWDEARRVHRKP